MNERAILLSTSLGHYETAYERVTGPFTPSASLVGLAELCLQRWDQNFFHGRWLELGCGLGSTFEGVSKQPEFVLGVDFARTAIEKAKARAPHFAHFETARLDSEWQRDWGQFDGVLDAHLLHCLEDEAAIRKVLKSTFAALKEGGTLVGEVMIHGRHFVPDSALRYDAHSGQLRNERGLIIHTLFDGLKWEKLLLECGFEIFYFEVYSHLRFIHNPKRSELLPSDPEVLRFIARKGRL